MTGPDAATPDLGLAQHLADGQRRTASERTAIAPMHSSSCTTTDLSRRPQLRGRERAAPSVVERGSGSVYRGITQRGWRASG